MGHRHNTGDQLHGDQRQGQCEPRSQFVRELSFYFRKHLYISDEIIAELHESEFAASLC